MKTFKCLLALTLGTAGLARADMPATHGMLLFGKQQTYASHLPMFHAPHDFQVLLKLQLPAAGQAGSGLVLANYEKAKAAGKTLFTIEPQTMDLTKVINGSLTSFSARLYDGHFERGGKNLGLVTVNVEKVIFAEKLQAQAPESDLKEYLLFGQNGEYFAAHLIKGKPSFDQIMQVSQPLNVTIKSCRTRACSGEQNIETVIPDAHLPATTAQFMQGPGDFLQAGQEIGFSPKATVQKVIYLEEAELSH